MRAGARALAGTVDAANVTDNQAATVKLSPLAASALMIEEGLEPILQMTTRDRNLLALQADLLGAWALGVRTVLALSGDPLKVGPYEALATHVGDVDSLGLTRLIAAMNEGTPGRRRDARSRRPASSSPTPRTRSSTRSSAWRAKLDAGARLFQTNIVYDVERFAEWFAPFVEAGVAERAPLLVGVTPPRSTRMLRHMHDNIPGIEVDDATFARMDGLEGDDAKAEGVAIAAELVQPAARDRRGRRRAPHGAGLGGRSGAARRRRGRPAPRRDRMRRDGDTGGLQPQPVVPTDAKPSLRELLTETDRFITAVELVTSRGLITESKPQRVLELARELARHPRIDVLSMTDNPAGNAMLAADTLGTDLISRGQEVIIHLACKDWNRNAIQSRAWKLASEGFHNILALSGDAPSGGYRGVASPVFDIDSVGLLQMYTDMNAGTVLHGRTEAEVQRTQFFLGTVVGRTTRPTRTRSCRSCSSCARRSPAAPAS